MKLLVDMNLSDISPALTGAKVIAALHQMKSELEAGALLSIDVSQTRLRLLPLTNPEGTL
ncbi:MAG: hypothetical protein ABSC55_12805 [Syntrophorhabdales bacterium]|jgi:hypothetical protein